MAAQAWSPSMPRTTTPWSAEQFQTIMTAIADSRRENAELSGRVLTDIQNVKDQLVDLSRRVDRIEQSTPSRDEMIRMEERFTHSIAETRAAFALEIGHVKTGKVDRAEFSPDAFDLLKTEVEEIKEFRWRTAGAYVLLAALASIVGPLVVSWLKTLAH